MKKKLKFIFINTFSFILLIFIAEFSLNVYNYYKDYDFYAMRYRIEKRPGNFNFLNYLAGIKERAYREYKYSDEKFRIPAIIKNPKKSSIILSGCSFAYGEFLEDNEAPHYILSKLTNRNVYNIALSAAGPREALYFLRHFEKKNKILHNDKNIEYFIYVYIDNHKYRSCLSLRSSYPEFKIINKGQNLQYVKRRLIFKYKLFYLSEIINSYKYRYYEKEKIAFKILCLYMREINREVKRQFGKNTKFIFFIYDGGDDFSILKQDGIIVINRELLNIDVNLNDPEYKVEDGHPNAKAWEVIMPKLVKQLNL